MKYLKLKTDFFTNPKTILLQKEKNCLLYQLLYLKLCILAINWNGALLFAENKALTIDNIALLTKIDKKIVKKGIKLFLELDILAKNNNVYYINDFQSMLWQ